MVFELAKLAKLSKLGKLKKQWMNLQFCADG